LEIGGQRIDRHYQEWNDVWNELSTVESKAIGLKAMQLDLGTGGGAGTGVGTAHIPLNFWFCRNPGLALPLIALQYHEVKLKFTWGAPGGNPTPDLWCDYIYLDTDERRRFAQVSHEYLIEQVQREEKVGAAASTTHKLNFNHPVKELIWTYEATNTMSDIKLQLNGHDRFSDQVEEYFTLRQPFDYHTAIPAQNLPSAAATITEYSSILSTKCDGLVFTNPATTTVQVGFTDTAVAQGGTVAGTCAVFDKDTGATHTGAAANQIFYTFLASDFTTNGELPVAGDKLLISYGGVQSSTGDANNTTQKIVKVISAESGANANINTIGTATYADGDFALVLDTILIDRASYSDNDAVDWSIHSITKIDNGCRTSKMTRKIGVYSFGLKPEEHQPSGTCNFSRIDNAQLVETSDTITDLKIYAVNYNVLRIMSGMGGLAYSN
jgi:hypothetical protein